MIRPRLEAFLLIALVALTLAVALIGRYPRPGFMSPRLLWTDPLALRLVVDLRLPRILAAAMVGMGLGVAGLVLQTLFGNPLVEPGLIGVSQGSAFGASLALVAFAPPLWIVQLVSAVTGGLGLVLSYRIARRFRFGGWILRLVLAGIAVSALFSAGVGIVKFVADPVGQLPAITFWLLGGLAATDWWRLAQVAPLVAASVVYAWTRRWRLNLLALEDRVSFSLGASPGRERLALLVAATVATASLVALSGIVGWVGLLVPHAARRLVGANTARSLPVSALLGGVFVLASDTIARTAIIGEIPLGVITSLIGAGGFIVLLLRNQVRVVR